MNGCAHCGATLPPAKRRPRKWCSEGCRRKAWDVANPKRCACGAEKSRRAARCWDCELDARDERRTARWTAIAELWNADIPIKEIVLDARVGRGTVNALNVEMDRMKKAGWDLPIRRPGWKDESAKHIGPPLIEKPTYTSREAAARIGHAVRSGQMEKPTTCERCQRNGRVEGHHHDYTKPLEVEWLCRSCHASHHVEERAVA